MNGNIFTTLIQNVQSFYQKLRNTDEVQTEVESVNEQLKRIYGSLKRERNAGGIKDIARTLEGLAFDAEDTIETYTIEVEERKRKTLWGKLISTPCHLAKLQSLEKKLERFQKKFLEASANSTCVDVNQNVGPSEDAAAEPQRRRREVETNDVVGFDEYTKKLVTQLTSEGEPNVVSIIGMGGLGKTTLAKKIYNEVKRHFDCYVWLYVSQDFEAIKFFLEIDETLVDMGVDELKEKLVKDFQGKKYLVVLDDIWKIEVWNEVKTAFPPNELNGSGSRILITSRIKLEYASYTSYAFPLPFLNEDESWKLLSKKMFLGKACGRNLETRGRKIAEACSGLPISIVELGNNLAEKEKTTQTLKYVEGNENSNLVECKNIRALKFTDIPDELLRRCFLYFGVYPEKFVISGRQLVQHWIAENFIGQLRDRDYSYSEKNAEQNLDELINRSLVLVDSWRTDGGVKTCHIHDLLRQLCILESKEELFFEVIRDGRLSWLSQIRRLSIQHSIDPILSSNPSTRPRSLIFFGRYGFNPDHCKWVLENFKSLRVLSIWGVDLCFIDKKIENLIMLKYLRIESRNLTEIPASICNLIYLETLDMKGTSLQRLPKGISKMRSLRNLYVTGPVKLPDDWDQKFAFLCNLRVLSTVSLDPRTVRPIVDAKLPEVRKLGIWFESYKSDSEVLDVLNGLIDLRYLEVLKIINYPDQPLPLPNVFPSTITKITLREVCLQDGGSMKELGNLPNLSILKIQHCLLPSGVLRVDVGSFPQLEFLKLEKLPIEEWEQEEDAMPLLNRLVIKELFNLTTLPSTIFSHTLPDTNGPDMVVEVVSSNLELVKSLKTLEESKKYPTFRLEVDPPIDDDNGFYQRIAVPLVTSSREPPSRADLPIDDDNGFNQEIAVPPVILSREPPSWIKWIQSFMVNILLCCGTLYHTSLQNPSS